MSKYRRNLVVNDKELTFFKNQISEDIRVIYEQWGYADNNLSKPEYAFNYWILSRIYNIDEEIIPEYITEYNDKSIDCFVHFEESKELYIIQNKYYSDNSSVKRNDVSDFLQTPLTLLNSNQYNKSAVLQNIYNKIKDDEEYKIILHFFATTENKSQDIDLLIKDFNISPKNVSCFISAELIGFNKLYELYYGKNYSENIPFNYNLGTINKGTFASLREEYGIEGLYEAYYIVTPVVQIYKMLLAAEKRGYPLFEKNIREYLGNNNINNGIVETLYSKDERKNFMYYNNGITVICQKIKSSYPDGASGLRMIPLVNPQIVNGCQTVSSIKKVLENIAESDIEKDYKNVYVMLKALVIEDPGKKQNKEFYNNVVKFTNKQNAISEKAFVSNMDVFYRLQDEFKKRGFLLLVKPSDNNKFKQDLTQIEKGDLIKKANENIDVIDFYLTNYTDICIPLEKLLQVFSAFLKTGYYAFVKKNLLLKQGSEFFDNYGSQIHNFITVDNMIKLYCIYKKAEAERKQSTDKRAPIPYYVVGFLGSLICDMTGENIQNSLNFIFSDKKIFKETYKYLIKVSIIYKRKYEEIHTGDGEGDYNVMIKKPIDNYALQFAIGTVNDIGDWEYISRWAK